MLETPEDLINNGDELIEMIAKEKQLPSLEGVEKKYDCIEVEFDP
jgi:hypothetical protein